MLLQLRFSSWRKGLVGAACLTSFIRLRFWRRCLELRHPGGLLQGSIYMHPAAELKTEEKKNRKEERNGNW